MRGEFLIVVLSSFELTCKHYTKERAKMQGVNHLFLNVSASAKCLPNTISVPSRSAIVLATLMVLKYALADRFNFSEAWDNSSCASTSSLMYFETSYEDREPL